MMLFDAGVTTCSKKDKSRRYSRVNVLLDPRE